MYYVLSAFIYLISLLPWRVLYFISDCFYVVAYYIVGYRKKVVMKNLAIAFPQKSEKEHVKIAKEFYHNFLDSLFELIKFVSLSDKEFSKRISGNFEVLKELYPTGQNIQLHSGHFFNIEYLNWGIPKYSPYPFIGVYMAFSNQAVERIILEMRRRYGSIMLSAGAFKTSFHNYAKQRYALGLAADQTPPNPRMSNWVHFFGRLTPFITGPEKSARINNTAVVFVHYYKVKRGFYRAHFELLTTTPRDLPKGTITREYVKFLERSINQNPGNYLWSHRRWKHEFKEEFRNLVID